MCSRAPPVSASGRQFAVVATPKATGQGRPPGQALWTAWPLLAAGATACASVLILSWWLTESIQDRVRGDIRNALEAVHQSTARSVDDWLTKITREVGAWARSPLVRDVVTSAATGRKVGELLTPLSGLPSFAGYLVLDPARRIMISDDRSLLTRKVSLDLGEGLIVKVASLLADVGERVANLDHRLAIDKPKPDPKGACVQ